MNGSRQRYRLDDYLQDKAQRAASPLARGGSSGLRQGMAVTPTGNASVGTVKPLPVRPPHTVQRPSGSNYNASGARGGQDVTVDTLKPDVGGGVGGGVLTQSQMTTAYTKQLMENALSNLLAMQNRKFQYDAHSSPLYSIVQKQAEESARLASGRAYAQAKAATGGYGSSYATLAADEAGRQAMQELDDQQLALYEAERAEFEAENASALDWYNTTKQLYADAYALEQAATESGVTTGASDAYNYVLSLGEDGWNGANEEAIRTMLNNQATAGGWTAEDVEKAISMLKAGDAAGVVDEVKRFEQAPTLSGAKLIYENNKNSGNWDTVAGKVSASLAKSFENALKDSESAYDFIGIDQAAWNEMDDETKSATIIQSAQQAVLEGIMAKSDFVNILRMDTQAAVKEIENSKGLPIAKSRMVFDTISGILMCVDNKTITREDAEKIIEDMTESPAVQKAYEKHKKALNSVANNKELKEKLGIEAMPDGFLRLNDAQEEALRELDKIFKKK